MEHMRNVAAIDVGINNFICMTSSQGYMPIIIRGGALKSMYHYYITERERLKQELSQKQPEQFWSKRLSRLTQTYNQKVSAWYDNVVQIVMCYCQAWEIDTLIVGDGKVSYIFNEKESVIAAPTQFIEILRRKCTAEGITFLQVAEQYTSGTSFIDGEYPCKENYDNTRCDGHNFRTDSGRIIHGDINASYQILRKVYPSMIDDKNISKYNLKPLILKITKDGSSYETGSNVVTVHK